MSGSGVAPTLRCPGKRRSGLLLVDEPRETLEREAVALRAETGDDPIGPQRHIGMMPTALAPMHIRDVHLEDRKLASIQRVEDRDGSMGEGGGVDDDPARILARGVNPID